MGTLFTGDVVVLEIGDDLALAVCGSFLQMMGCNVTRIESSPRAELRNLPPLLHAGAEELGASYAYLNNAKRIVQLDPDNDKDNSQLSLLIEGADILLVSASLINNDGVLSKESLARLSPKLVVGKVSMFGETGPYSDLKGGELQVLALGGLLHLIGDPEREPIRLGGYQAQYATGLSLLAGVLAATHRKDRDGIGASVATSALETVSYVEWKEAIQFQNDGAGLARGGEGGPMILPCKDGFSAFYYRNVDWPSVKELFPDVELDSSDFETQADRDKNRERLIEIISASTRQKTKQALYHSAQRLKIPIGYVATMSDLFQSEQYETRRFLQPLNLGKFGIGLIPSAPWQITDMKSFDTTGIQS